MTLHSLRVKVYPFFFYSISSFFAYLTIGRWLLGCCRNIPRLRKPALVAVSRSTSPMCNRSYQLCCKGEKKLEILKTECDAMSRTKVKGKRILVTRRVFPKFRPSGSSALTQDFMDRASCVITLTVLCAVNVNYTVRSCPCHELYSSQK